MYISDNHVSFHAVIMGRSVSCCVCMYVRLSVSYVVVCRCAVG